MTDRASRLAEWSALAKHASQYSTRRRSGNSIPVPKVNAAGDALHAAISEISSSDIRLKEMVGLLRGGAEYLDALESNMLRNDADMTLDKCDPPSDWAARLRTAADQIDPAKESNNGR